MYKRYLYKYNELTGNLSKEEIKKKISKYFEK